ncbi:NAD(P)-binding domain-containing protein (plasmid) [Klebsiella pneumoniae subsp. pneumoniae]
MGMGAARACLQAGLNTWALTSIPTTVAHCWRRAPKARPQRGAVRRGTGCSCAAGGQCRPGAGILFGESGLAAHLKPGTVVMVSSTIASADAQAIAEALAEYQLLMLDAPVSGGAVKAAAGDMTVMASGSDAAFARLAPVLDAVAGKVYRIGATLVLARR